MLSQTITAMAPNPRIETSFKPHFGVGREISDVVFRLDPEGEACKPTWVHYDLPANPEGVRQGWPGRAASLIDCRKTGQPIKLG